MTSAVCLTFDLDAETAWISRDPANLHRLAVMSQGVYGPKVGVPLLLDFLDENGLRATFFVPGWTAERYPDVVAEIHRRGHEVGHHGYLHDARGALARRGGGDPREDRGHPAEHHRRAAGGLSRAAVRGSPTRRRGSSGSTASSTHRISRTRCDPASTPARRPWSSSPPRGSSTTGRSSPTEIRPPLYRQIFPPAAVLSIWKDEFRGMHPLGGAYTLILHPQYIGRPSRVLMLQALLDYIRTFPGAWITHGVELARWVASEASGAGTDGRPVLGSRGTAAAAPRPRRRPGRGRRQG